MRRPWSAKCFVCSPIASFGKKSVARRVDSYCPNRARRPGRSTHWPPPDCGSNSRLRKHRTNPLRQAGVRAPRTLQPKDAARQEAVAPGRRDVVEVLERRRAELVVVRVVAFRENQTPRRRQQRLRGFLIAAQQRQRLSRRRHLVVADIG